MLIIENLNKICFFVYKTEECLFIRNLMFDCSFIPLPDRIRVGKLIGLIVSRAQHTRGQEWLAKFTQASTERATRSCEVRSLILVRPNGSSSLIEQFVTVYETLS